MKNGVFAVLGRKIIVSPRWKKLEVEKPLGVLNIGVFEYFGYIIGDIKPPFAENLRSSTGCPF